MKYDKLTGLKRCSRCRKVKELSEFHKDKLRSDGMNNWCKACVKEWQTKPENYPKIKQTAHEWSVSEKGKEYHKKYMDKNREYYNAYSLNFYRTNECVVNMKKEKAMGCALCGSKSKNRQGYRFYDINTDKVVTTGPHFYYTPWNVIWDEFSNYELRCPKCRLKIYSQNKKIERRRKSAT